MAFSNPSVADFKGFFVRDFPYGTDIETSVIDADITKAFQMVNVNINPGLFSDQSTYTVGYLFMTAHFLVMDIRAGGQGISGQFNFGQNSKSVGAVSESFSIPQRVLDNPYWAMLTKTNYGAQFLQMILPQLAGQMFVAYGSTRP